MTVFPSELSHSLFPVQKQSYPEVQLGATGLVTEQQEGDLPAGVPVASQCLRPRAV